MEIQNKYNLFFLCFLILFFLAYNYLFYFNINCWFDEWATLLVTDPSIDMKEFFSRLNGNENNNYIPENVPFIYYLALKYFFFIFGYTIINGKIFSILFFLGSLLILYRILLFISDKKFSSLIIILITLNPYLIYLANEIRVGTFLLFFFTLNIYFFFLNLNSNNKYYKSFLIISNVVVLSIYPISIVLIFSQILCLLIRNIYNKKKYDINLIFLIILSLLIYIFLNYDYYYLKVETSINHWAKLNYNFFIGFYFNIFFSSIIFGAIFFLLFLYLIFANFKNLLKDTYLTYIFIIIIITYLFIIFVSTFLTPIASPKYISFLIPLIYIWIFINLKNNINPKNLKYFISLIIILLIHNISFTENKWLPKPPTEKALELVINNQINQIYINPSSLNYKFFKNYMSIIEKNQIYKFKIINDKDLEDKKYMSFSYICLNNPRYHTDINLNKIDKSCKKNFINYLVVKEIIIEDYLIQFFEYNA